MEPEVKPEETQAETLVQKIEHAVEAIIHPQPSKTSDTPKHPSDIDLNASK